MDQHVSQIYAHNLLPLREGYPLWIPEPDEELPLCYRQSGARIGDVGVISQDGGFQFLFNICSSADDPVNQGGVPPNFEHIEIGPTCLRPSYFNRNGAFVQSADFAMKSISIDAGADAALVPVGVEFAIEFSVEKDEGAILAPPQGGSRRDAKQLRAYEKQIQRHGQEWYAYVQDDLGWKIDNGDLYLVTGIDKVPTWGALTFRDAQRSHAVSFQFTAAPMAHAGLRHDYQWRHLTSQSARQGPDARTLICGDDGLPVENQCVFVRGYKIMIRRRFWLRKQATSLKVVDYTGSRNFGKPASLKTTSSPVVSTSQEVTGKAQQVEAAEVCTDTADESQGSVKEEDVNHDSSIDSNEDESWETDEKAVFEPFPASTTPYHPSDVLNQYIMDNTNCNIAYTHDDVWMSTSGDVNVINDLNSQDVLVHYELETVGEDAVTLRRIENVENPVMNTPQDRAEDVMISDAGKAVARKHQSFTRTAEVPPMRAVKAPPATLAPVPTMMTASMPAEAVFAQTKPAPSYAPHRDSGDVQTPHPPLTPSRCLTDDDDAISTAGPSPHPSPPARPSPHVHAASPSLTYGSSPSPTPDTPRPSGPDDNVSEDNSRPSADTPPSQPLHARSCNTPSQELAAPIEFLNLHMEETETNDIPGRAVDNELEHELRGGQASDGDSDSDSDEEDDGIFDVYEEELHTPHETTTTSSDPSIPVQSSSSSADSENTPKIHRLLAYKPGKFTHLVGWDFALPFDTNIRRANASDVNLSVPATMPLTIDHNIITPCGTVHVAAVNTDTVRVIDFLRSLHTHFDAPAAPAEYKRCVAEHGVTRVSTAFYARCDANPDAAIRKQEIGRGVLRLDLLLGETHFGGLAKRTTPCQWELFTRPKDELSENVNPAYKYHNPILVKRPLTL